MGDMFVYADSITYMQPVGKDDVPGERPGAPHPVIGALAARDTGVFRAKTYSTDPPLRPEDSFDNETFERFSAWTRSNVTGIRGWLNVQRQPWIRTMKRSMGRHVFDLEPLESDRRFVQLAQELKETPRALVHLFDVNIRIPYYVRSLGDGAVFAHHPVRSSFCLPAMQAENAQIRRPALSFKRIISKLAPQLSYDEFAILLHELRGEVRDRKLGLLGPGEIEKEQIRDICKAVRFPPRVKSEVLQWLQVIGAITVVGIIVSVLTNVWSGELPRAAASPRFKWLHPYLEWDLEKQATSPTTTSS